MFAAAFGPRMIFKNSFVLLSTVEKKFARLLSPPVLLLLCAEIESGGIGNEYAFVQYMDRILSSMFSDIESPSPVPVL